MCSSACTSAGWLLVVWCEEILRAQLSLGELQVCCMLCRVGCSNEFISGVLKLLVNVTWTLFPLICYVLTLFVFNIKNTAIRSTFNKFCENSQNLLQSKMYKFQEWPEYILSEHWKDYRLSSFSCLSPVICNYSEIDFLALFHIFFSLIHLCPCTILFQWIVLLFFNRQFINCTL